MIVDETVCVGQRFLNKLRALEEVYGRLSELLELYAKVTFR